MTKWMYLTLVAMFVFWGSTAHAERLELGREVALEFSAKDWRYMKSTQLVKSDLWVFENIRHSELRAFIDSRAMTQATSLSKALVTKQLCESVMKDYASVKSMKVNVSFIESATKPACSVKFRTTDSVTHQLLVLSPGASVYVLHAVTVVYPAKLVTKVEADASRFLASLGERQ